MRALVLSVSTFNDLKAQETKGTSFGAQDLVIAGLNPKDVYLRLFPVTSDTLLKKWDDKFLHTDTAVKTLKARLTKMNYVPYQVACATAV